MRTLGHFTVVADHPALAGHFPGRPVVPGVVLLDEVFALLLEGRPGERVAAAPMVKFVRPVLPGQQVTVQCTADGAPGTISFACRVAEGEALRGLVQLERAVRQESGG